MVDLGPQMLYYNTMHWKRGLVEYFHLQLDALTGAPSPADLVDMWEMVTCTFEDRISRHVDPCSEHVLSGVSLEFYGRLKETVFEELSEVLASLLNSIPMVNPAVDKGAVRRKQTKGRKR